MLFSGNSARPIEEITYINRGADFPITSLLGPDEVLSDEWDLREPSLGYLLSNFFSQVLFIVRPSIRFDISNSECSWFTPPRGISVAEPSGNLLGTLP